MNFIIRYKIKITVKLTKISFTGKKDDILSPSSRLMLGQPCKSGTGAFSVLPSLYM